MIDEYLHGALTIPCINSMSSPALIEKCKNETLHPIYSEEHRELALSPHFLNLLASELILEFVTHYNPDNWKKLPNIFKEKLSYDKVVRLSAQGEEYRIENRKSSWVSQVLNIKDTSIHGPHFSEDFKGYNSSATIKVNSPRFPSNFDPEKHILSAKFAGRSFNPLELFEKRRIDVSHNCIGLRKDVLNNMKQSIVGATNGLKITMFMGYPGVGRESLYKSLQRKPSLIAFIDQPSNFKYISTHKPINFYDGALRIE